MATFTRNNAWNNGGTFDNTDLLWYAKAVAVMQAKPVADPMSWWFWAAIHGEFLKRQDPKGRKYLNWQNIAYIPASAKLGTLPKDDLINLFWDQCQHGTWYFPPWHRGYLVALESILRDIIVNQLQGPSTWALPYWNYLNQSKTYTENYIPPAFQAANLPDGTPNPLYVPERYGPKGNGTDIFTELATNPDDGTDDLCQYDITYTLGEANQPEPPGQTIFGNYYGGLKTKFSFSGSGAGDMEINPHGSVHVDVGGQSNANGQQGLMAVVPVAGLDPVFFLHHCNIDRMWAAWTHAGNQNPTDQFWLGGPASQGDRKFAMPLDDKGTPWVYTPKDVQTTIVNYKGSPYSYTYDDLSLASYSSPPPPPQQKLATRLNVLGKFAQAQNILMAESNNSELMGASENTDPINLQSGENHAAVKLARPVLKTVSDSLLSAEEVKQPDEVYLQLEGITGANDANFLSVYVNQKFVKTIPLFGLSTASAPDAHHGNAGLTFKLDITNIIDELHLSHNLNVSELDVQINPKKPLPAGHEIKVARISVYRVGH